MPDTPLDARLTQRELLYMFDRTEAYPGIRAAIRAALDENQLPLDVRRDPDGRIRSLLTEAIASIEAAPFAHEKLTGAQVILDGLRIEFGGPPYRREPHDA